MLLRINICFQKSISRFILYRGLFDTSSTINTSSGTPKFAMASDTRPPAVNGKVREKVALKPGFHLADWVRLTQVSKDLSGLNGNPMHKISLKELSEHNSQFDCWVAYKGKVYNISNYLPYHPGGAEILKKSAGKDCTVLFDKYHRWVNCDQILGKCQVGFLQAELSSFEDEEELEDEVTISTCSERKQESKLDVENDVKASFKPTTDPER
jgi:cytochrome b involved in lipid metabolism